MTVAAFCVALLFGGAMFFAGLAHKPENHSCNAPCVIKFEQPMHEDQFCIDYRGDGTLKTWKEDEGCYAR